MYLCMEPSKKSIQRAKDRIKEVICTKHGFVPIPELIEQLNLYLKGWKAYFSQGYPRKSMREINRFVRGSLAKHLKRRSQRRYRPSEGTSFYKELEKLGLVYL